MKTYSGGPPGGTQRPAQPGATENRFGGTVYGPAVQARDIHGGFHVHRPADPVPTPRQLPAPGPLVGREAEIAALDGIRASGAVGTALVSGPAGIGKTALTLHWAHLIRADYPDGQLYADLQGHAPGAPLPPDRVLAGFLRALGAPPDRLPADLPELAALYRSMTADRRILVVLDDALSAAQVRPLLPGAATSLALVTSRWRLTGLLAHGARAVQLDRLDEEAALGLLSLTVGADRTTAEPESARRMVLLCARYPLALSVAGARLAARPGWPLGEMADALAQEHGRLSVLSTEEDDLAVRGAIDLSYRALPQPAARLYRLLGLFPGVAFESDMVAALAGVPLPAARELLHVLADANLVRDSIAGRYRFHDLIRLHAAEMAARDEPETKREQAVRRMLDWYLATTLAARTSVAPYREPLTADVPPTRRFDGPDHALDWMEQELPELREIVRLAIREGRCTLGWQLVSATWPLFQHRGRYAERLELDYLGLDAAKASGDPEGNAMMRNRLGLALRDRGRLDEAGAHFAEALAIWRELDRPSRVISSLRRLAITAGDRGDLAQAIDHLREALDLCRSTPSTSVRALALAQADLGDAFTRAGRPHEAIAHLQEAGRLLAKVPDPYNQARAVIRLGRAHAATGATQRAQSLFTDALTMMRDIGSPPGEAEAQEELGDVARALGRTEEADRWYRQALDILDGLGSPGAQAVRDRLGSPPSRGDFPAQEVPSP